MRSANYTAYKPAELWALYQKLRSLRDVAAFTGMNHETVRLYLIEAGYDINSVPKRDRPTYIKGGRVRAQGSIHPDDAMLLDEQPEGISYHVYKAVRDYCDNLVLNDADLTARQDLEVKRTDGKVKIQARLDRDDDAFLKMLPGKVSRHIYLATRDYCQKLRKQRKNREAVA